MRLSRTFRPLAPFVVTLTLGALAYADAPPTQYGPFGPSDVTIDDLQTGLTWQRDVTFSGTFAQAVAYCAAQSQRLPSYKELQTLLDETPHYEYTNGRVQILIDPNAFRLTPVDMPYWSSSVDPASGGAFVVDFGRGTGSTSPVSATAYARCVGN